jgi:hypothetical protein
MEKPMASEERDRKFDQALARHLRSAAASTEAASAATASASSRSACPDAEILAAYHERSLLPEEMNSWKEHIAGCGTCQTILAHLETTDEIPVQAVEKEELLAAGAALPAMASLTRAAVPMPAAPASAEEESRDGVMPPPKKRDSRFSHGPRWRWLAPAGAIAAGLLVWIAMHENQTIPIHSASEPKVASNSPAAIPAPAAQPTLTSPAPPTAGAAPQEMTASAGRPAVRIPKDQNAIALSDESKTAGAAASADKEEGLRKEAERRTSEGFSRAARVGSLDTKAVPSGVTGGIAGAAKEKTESPAEAQTLTSEIAATQQVQVEEQGANAQQQNQVNANMQKVPGPAPLGQANSTHALKRVVPERQAPQQPASAPAPGAMNDQAAASMDLVAASNLHLIPAPGAAVIWRVGPAGSIQFSKDKGASWSPQTSGVSADLLTGSAPSEKICWLVGRAGTILRTNDGGAYWKVVNSPISGDLGGINAADSLHAKIWDLHSTRFFATTDGGQTWNRVPAQ